MGSKKEKTRLIIKITVQILIRARSGISVGGQIYNGTINQVAIHVNDIEYLSLVNQTDVHAR
jgi:hypothetical protein